MGLEHPLQILGKNLRTSLQIVATVSWLVNGADIAACPDLVWILQFHVARGLRLKRPDVMRLFFGELAWVSGGWFPLARLHVCF